MAIQENPSIEERFLAQVDVEESPSGDETAPTDSPEEGDIDGQAEEDTEADAAAVEDVDQDEDDSEPDAEPGAADFIEYVDRDGNTQRLTADEASRGVLLMADYSRKMNDLADARKQFEEQRQQAAQKLQAEIDSVAQLAAQFQDQEPDWDALYDEDPLRAPKIERDFRAKQAAQRRALQDQAIAHERARQEHMARQAALLPELIPEWSDSGVARTEQQALQQALIDDGFSPEDVAQVADARLVRWLRRAHMGFQADKAGSTVAAKKVKGKPRVQKPGAPSRRSDRSSVSARKRDIARKTQSKDAWTDVFEDFV